MATPLVGYQCKMYYLPAGDRTAWDDGGSEQSLTEIGNLRDVTPDLSNAVIDATTRETAASGFEAVVAGLASGKTSFQMLWKGTDAAFAAINTARENKTKIALLVATGDKTTAGTQGLWADFVITKFTMNQPLKDVVTVDVEAQITDSGVVAEWITVTT